MERQDKTRQDKTRQDKTRQGDRWRYIVDQANLQTALEKSRIPYVDIPARAGIGRKTLNKMFAGESVGKKSLCKVAGELNVPYTKLIKKVVWPESFASSQKIHKTSCEGTTCGNRRIGAEDMKREELLEVARKATCGERDENYGTPEDNFGLIAYLWSGYMGVPFSPKDVSMLMVLLKVARIKSGTATVDSFVDIAGYAACGGEIATEKGLTEKETMQ